MQEFLAAVFSSWVEKVGIMLTVLPFVEKVPFVRRRLKDRPILERFAPLIWVIGGVCIFYGFYNAWQSERQIGVDAKNETAILQRKLDNLTVPALRGEIKAVFLAPAGPKNSDTLVVSVVRIYNNGAPSIADVTGMKLRLTNGKEVVLADVPPLLPPQKLTFSSSRGQPRTALLFSDYLPSKAINNPIITGGAVKGWTWGLGKGVTMKEASSLGTLVIVSFKKDVAGHPYEMQWTMDGRFEENIINPLTLQDRR